MSIKFYCDESGNTGVDYISENDPFFVVGGWLDKEKISENEEFIKTLRNMLTKEGKANKLHKSVAGRKVMIEVIRYLKDKKCIPFVSIAYKRYATAARIVAVLLDPEYNDWVNSNIEKETEGIRRSIANIFFELDNKTIDLFAEAYRNLNVTLMKKCVDLIVIELENKQCERLADIVNNSKKKIDRNLCDQNTKSLKKNQSPNVWELYMLCYMLNIWASSQIEKIEVIHDEQLQYGDNIKNIEKLCFREKIDDVDEMALPMLESLNFVNSENEIMVQCADILVGSINFLLKQLNKSNDIYKDASKRDLFIELFPIIFGYLEENAKTYFSTHEKHINKMITPLIEYDDFYRLIKQR